MRNNQNNNNNHHNNNNNTNKNNKSRYCRYKLTISQRAILAFTTTVLIIATISISIHK